GQDNINITSGDFNKDGVIDTLKTFYDGGSGFGGNYVGVVNGKTNEYYELNDDRCFCEIKHTVIVPPELDKLENKPFLEKIKSELLPRRRNQADPLFRLDDKKFF